MPQGLETRLVRMLNAYLGADKEEHGSAPTLLERRNLGLYSRQGDNRAMGPEEGAKSAVE